MIKLNVPWPRGLTQPHWRETLMQKPQHECKCDNTNTKATTQLIKATKWKINNNRSE